MSAWNRTSPSGVSLPRGLECTISIGDDEAFHPPFADRRWSGCWADRCECVESEVLGRVLQVSTGSLAPQEVRSAPSRRSAPPGRSVGTARDWRRTALSAVVLTCSPASAPCSTWARWRAESDATGESA